ncbi:MAG: hypothetical protein KAR20_03980 [Candidatus Heimdallarchaeota archaeon]|nr:hypothetical protein [Candidatus Heimdallarchaeota archaeon]
MNIQELVQRFLETEKKYNLFEAYSNEDIPLWFLLRFPVWSSIILVKKLNLDQIWVSYKEQELKSQFEIGLNILKGTITRNPFIGLKEYDFLFLDSDRRQEISGNFYDIYVDYLLLTLDEYSCLNLIRTGGKHYHSLATKNFKYLDAVNFTTYIKSKFLKRDKVIINRIEEILRIFSEVFDLKMNMDKETERLYFDKIFNFIEYKKAFKKILIKVNPKVIFEISHYGSKSIAMNVTAHEMNVPTIELQHGTINQYHIGYNYANLKSGGNYPPLPQYIFLFGEYWRKACKLPISEQNKIVTGFPHFESKRKVTEKISKKSKQILFLSQRLIGIELAKIAYDLAQEISEEYKIVYKLHPAEYMDWKERYGWLSKLPNVEIPDKNSKKSLYHLFAESDVQVGVFSTAIYEGLGFGLKTFIVDLPGHEYMNDLIESAFVSFVGNADEILENIDKKHRDIQDIGDQIWQSNALDNMKTEIESIVKRC